MAKASIALPTFKKDGLRRAKAQKVINLDGTKELLTDFEQIFKIAGMDYMFGL